MTRPKARAASATNAATGEKSPAAEVIEKLSMTRVRFEDIEVDREFNSRKDYKDIESLMEEIRTMGLISPVVVDPHPKKADRYLLTSGYRRMEAMRRLREEARTKKEPLPFEHLDVRLHRGPEVERWILNLGENIWRMDLHVWEIGDQCSKMRDRFQMGGSQIGDKLGKWKKGHINNCMRVVENIAPDVQKQFREGRADPPFAFLLQLAAFRDAEGKPDHDRQRKVWQKWMIGGDGDGGGSSDGGSAGDADKPDDVPGRMRRLREGEKALLKLQAALKAAEREEDRIYFRGGINVAKYLMGMSETIPKVNLTKTKGERKRTKSVKSKSDKTKAKSKSRGKKES